MKLYNNNRVKRGIFLLGLVFSLSSCDDFLTHDKINATTDEDFWETQQQCESALNECRLWVKGCYGGGEICMVLQDAATDNGYWTADWDVRVRQLGNGTLAPPSDANNPGGFEAQFSTWAECYLRIRRVARLLDNIDRAYFVNESERARIKAEARVWRAWLHIRLLNWYGRTDGIPYVDHALLPSEIYMARTPVTECLDRITVELDDVINSKALPFIWDEGNRAGRMSTSIALALKMDVNFQHKRYDVAKQAAQALIDSGEFELYYSPENTDYPGKNYRDLFNYTGEMNKERIFYRENGLDNGFFRYASGQLSGGQGGMSVLKSMVDEYETVDGKTLAELSAAEREEYEKAPLYGARDPRLNVTVYTPGDNVGLNDYTFEPFNPDRSDYYGRSNGIRSGYMLKKYLTERDRGNGGQGNLDFMLYRYAEVLLDYVECCVETGDWQNPRVVEYLNAIRTRAGMPEVDKTVYNSEAKIRELYRRERRVELAFEGKRYDDIRRWGIGTEVMNGPIFGAWNPETSDYMQIEVRNVSFPKFDSWPLRQEEDTTNPNISQPTGW